MSEWQPIETAPKDGRPILVYDPHCGDDPPIFMAEWIESMGCFCIFNDPQPLDPTDWMPLPPPPASKSDLARVDRMTDDDIDYSDIPPLDETFLTKPTVEWPPAKPPRETRTGQDLIDACAKVRGLLTDEEIDAIFTRNKSSARTPNPYRSAALILEYADEQLSAVPQNERETILQQVIDELTAWREALRP